ncbi:MAG: Processing alpha glucosidase I [Alyxoria varia]|nr:MAG: Processing alpha glucosidase I [Alyxoria varia]
MAGYGWDEYDPRIGGKQTIHDAENQLDITTELVKKPGGDHGGSWGVRVRGTPRKDTPQEFVTTVVFYIGVEGLGTLSVTNPYDKLGYKGAVNMEGRKEELGEFEVTITDGPKSNRHPPKTHETFDKRPLDRSMVHSVNVPESALWQAKGYIFKEFKRSFDEIIEKYGQGKAPPPWQSFTMETTSQQSGNLHMIQKVYRDSFQFDILFSSSSATERMTSSKLDDALEESSKNFGERYKQKFAAQPPFDKPKYDTFSKTMFSNLAGGIGYFYGDQVIDRSYAEEYDEENEGFWEEAAEARAAHQEALQGPYELLTTVPSRPFFPRGFLWDEGFHLMPILDWDMGVAIEILRSWFNTMDEDGWIPREQILGDEARTKVPAEFQVQYPHYANPPTLFLVIEGVMDKVSSKELPQKAKDKYTDILRSMYPLLKRNYHWYRKTQRGDLKSYDRKATSPKEGYRWRGRTPTHILTSGIDDYPRAQPPHPGELHLDLISWIGLMSRSLRRIATFLSETDDVTEYSAHEKAITANIDDLHWDSKAQTYCDATVDEYEESRHECHKGYVSIFPFLTGMLSPDNPHLEAVLDLIGDDQQLWSPHGIRSLSKQDEFYGTDENYWRSPVWVNINYLVLTNLRDVASPSSNAPGKVRNRARTLYSELRRNLVNTVYESWRETGFAWEQYNPDTGKGQRTQHFTGWTSLVVKIMCMPDLSGSEDGRAGSDGAGGGHEEL